MLDFESFKNEIVDSIDKVKEQQEITNEHLELLIPVDNEEKTEEVEENENTELDNTDADLLDVETDDQVNNESINLEELETEILIQQNESIIEQLEELNKNNIESSWLISLTIVIALGFHYFINQFSKW